jgi:ergothioneine biosynthesis protein EgtB
VALETRSLRDGASSSLLLERYRDVRSLTEWLVEPLSPEDSTVQSMPDASPAKWHLAHTSWFFETFVLERASAGFRPFDPRYRVLFNSYYNSVGDQHPRPDRGLVSRPSLREVREYRAHVDRCIAELVERVGVDDATAGVIELGLHHEQQHQELVLTDVKHMLAQNPLRPTYRDCPSPPPADPGPIEWCGHPGGIASIGSDGDAFTFDNERPRHRVLLEPFQLASRLVTNREYLAFIADRGYETATLWLSDGWSAATAGRWQSPLYWWRDADGAWWTLTLGGPRQVALDEPVCHVSYYEADAFARWAGARLPREEEWEVFGARATPEGNFLENGLLHPAPYDGSDDGPAQLYGDVWEWSQSPYAPYPGFRAEPGALGEYNGKFMVNQLVLRGGSCATPRSHIRATYRNFFPPHARWQFSGIRLARDGH